MNLFFSFYRDLKLLNFNIVSPFVRLDLAMSFDETYHFGREDDLTMGVSPIVNKFLVSDEQMI